MRWTDGSPLVNFDHWNFPDMVNAIPKKQQNTEFTFEHLNGHTKSPRNQRLASALQMLQPNYHDATRCGATFMNNYVDHSWMLVPCRVRFNTTLICQSYTKQSKRIQRILHCMGQTYMLSKWCIVHIPGAHDKNPTFQCKSWNRDRGDLNRLGDWYFTTLCLTLTVLVTTIDALQHFATG